MKERDYCFLLARIEGFTPLMIRRLLGLYGGAEQVFKQETLPVSEVRQAAFLAGKDRAAEWLARRDQWEKEGIHWCWYGDPDYPARLNHLPDSPLGLYYRGRLPENDKPAVGIVGARRCSSYGRTMAERFGGSLGAQGIRIISGMALGVDGYAQQAALKEGGLSFGILGCGVDICYPPAHQTLYRDLGEKGGIISELPPGTPPLPHHFPLRNRLIAAFSDLLLVLEAREKSGSLITVDQALEQGKDVLALPGRVGDALSAGCNQLIRQGAGLLSCCGDVYELLGLREGPQKSPGPRTALTALTAEQQALYRQMGTGPRHVEELMLACDLELGPLSLILLELESLGHIRQISSGTYIRC